MKQNFRTVILVLLLAAPFMWSVVSCKKPEWPNAIITVKSPAGSVLPNSLVTVYSSPNGSIIREDLRTNEAGQVRFEIENECILNVKAVYTGNQQYLEGYGLIILKQGETYYETVTVN